MSDLEKQIWVKIQPVGRTKFVLSITLVFGLSMFFANFIMAEKVTVGFLLFLFSACLFGGLIVGLSIWYLFKKKYEEKLTDL